MDIQQLIFNSIVDERGELVALEWDREIPFPVKRVYYMYNVPESVSRGYHAHKQLRQVLVCVSGRCKVLLDNGKNRTVVELDRPTKGLLINNLIWREIFDFSADAVLLVFASEKYDEDDYIRNYDDFISVINNKFE